MMFVVLFFAKAIAIRCSLIDGGSAGGRVGGGVEGRVENILSIVAIIQ
jgi:hypothetical protein